MAMFEGRKLQLAGGSTYVISLPKQWVTGAGLKAGDTLFVEAEGDGSVSVRHPTQVHSETRRKVFVEKGEEARDHLLRKLIGAYVSGFGLITIQFPPDRGPFVRKVARDFCRLVVGPEVVEESRGDLQIQDLSDPTDLSTEKCLRRMHLIVRTMLEDALVALKTGKSALAQDVTQRDQDVDRLYWMVAKRFHLSHQPPSDGPSRKKRDGSYNSRMVAKLFERIGDHAERIASTFDTLGEGDGLDPKLMKDFEEAKDSALAILERAFTAYISGDIEAANEAIDANVRHQKLVDALSHRVATRKGEQLLALGTVVNSLARTGSYAADIAEEAIDMTILTGP